jgi:hypothetical protein
VKKRFEPMVKLKACFGSARGGSAMAIHFGFKVLRHIVVASVEKGDVPFLSNQGFSVPRLSGRRDFCSFEIPLCYKKSG